MLLSVLHIVIVDWLSLCLIGQCLYAFHSLYAYSHVIMVREGQNNILSHSPCSFFIFLSKKIKITYGSIPRSMDCLPYFFRSQ